MPALFRRSHGISFDKARGAACDTARCASAAIGQARTTTLLFRTETGRSNHERQLLRHHDIP